MILERRPADLRSLAVLAAIDRRSPPASLTCPSAWRLRSSPQKWDLSTDAPQGGPMAAPTRLPCSVAGGAGGGKSQGPTLEGRGFLRSAQDRLWVEGGGGWFVCLVVFAKLGSYSDSKEGSFWRVTLIVLVALTVPTYPLAPSLKGRGNRGVRAAPSYGGAEIAPSNLCHAVADAMGAVREWR
jgi:hypothetical protein